MGPYNKPKNKDTSFIDASGAGASAGRTDELANQVGETRGAITSDIKELGDKFSSNQLKVEAKNVGRELASGAQEVVVDKAIEVKDAVVDKAIEVKDVVVDKAIEVKDIVVDKATEIKDVIVEKTAEVTDAAAEKLDEAKLAVYETLDQAGETAARWSGATLRFAKSNAVPLVLIGLGATWLIGNSTRTTRTSVPRPSAPTVRTRRYEQADLSIAGDGFGEDRVAWDSLASERNSPDYKATTASSLRASSKSMESKSIDSKSIDSKSTESRSSALLHGADDLMQRGKQLARREATAARAKLVRAKDASLDYAEANPLAVALAALTLGVGVGVLLPTTEPEERLLRPARQKFERLVGDAREVASDVVEIAKETANESMARA